MRIVFVTGKSGAGKTTFINEFVGREGEKIQPLLVGQECRKKFGEAEMAKATNAAAPEYTEDFVRGLVLNEALRLKSLEEVNNDGPWVLLVDGVPRKTSQVAFVLTAFHFADETEIMFVTCDEETREARLNGRDTTEETKALRRARAQIEDANLLQVMGEIFMQGGGHLVSTVRSRNDGFDYFPKPKTDLHTIFTEHYRFSNLAMSRTGVRLVDLHNSARYRDEAKQGEPCVVWARKFAEKAQEELGELMREVPDQWWSIDPVDLRAARVELMDSFIFHLSVAAALGMGPEQFAQHLFDKMQVNFMRQAVGYRKAAKGELRDDAHVGMQEDDTKGIATE